MKPAPSKTVYKLTVEDLQYVATDVLQRQLNSEEIAAVRKAVGDYIDWFQAIENAIYRCLPTASRASTT
jgi:hypothetical protein